MKNLGWGICIALVMGSMMAQAIEEPAWTLVAQLDNVEIRQYDALVQARTAIDSNSESSGGFRTLADYIFGGNAREQSIAMTAPVEESLAGEEAYMAFTMPSQYSLEDLPAPVDDRVTLHEISPRTMAVVSFSGWAREAVVEKQAQILLDTLEGNGWVAVSALSLNQYNPPWTLPWSRRNEVMVQVQNI